MIFEFIDYLSICVLVLILCIGVVAGAVAGNGFFDGFSH